MSTGRDNINQLSLIDLPKDLLEKEIYPHVIKLKSVPIVIALAETCKMLYQLFQPQLDQYAAEKLIKYITSSGPRLIKEERMFEKYFPNMRFFYHSQLSSPKTNEIDINYEMAKEMVEKNPRLIFTEDIDNKFDRHTDVTRHSPSYFASHTRKYKIDMFMRYHKNTNKILHHTDTQTESNSDAHEPTGFKYDFTVD